MLITVRRKMFTDKSTIGELSIDGKNFCYTLEDTDRLLENKAKVKIPGQSAIPRGKYHVQITFSQRFGKYLPILLDVPDFAGVRIHPGNKAEDTEGCILVGDSFDVDCIYNSRITFNRLFDLIETQLNHKHLPVEIEIC